MSLLLSSALVLGLLNWFGVTVLVRYDARARGLRSYWQWGVLTAVLGVFAALLYVSTAVVPSDRADAPL